MTPRVGSDQTHFRGLGQLTSTSVVAYYAFPFFIAVMFLLAVSQNQNHNDIQMPKKEQRRGRGGAMSVNYAGTAILAAEAFSDEVQLQSSVLGFRWPLQSCSQSPLCGGVGVCGCGVSVHCVVMRACVYEEANRLKTNHFRPVG